MTSRRQILKLAVLSGAGFLTQTAVANCEKTDGTPLQFVPKTAPDETPLENELTKYPKCPYCGMDRKEHHRTRMLVHYSDKLADGVCSIHCLGLSLSLNIDREPINIWGVDYAGDAEPRPLIAVEKLQYLIGAKIPMVMTTRSKHSFANAEQIAKAKSEFGGEVGDFNAAIEATYLDMAKDVARIRKNRAEKRMKMKM